jgi:hypothetical protein
MSWHRPARAAASLRAGRPPSPAELTRRTRLPRRTATRSPTSRSTAARSARSAGYTFTNIHGTHTIAATFSFNGPYTIDASAGTGGTIAPSGAVSVVCGTDQGFSVVAGDCYSIADVAVDGSSIGAVAGYTFTSVHGAHTIAATFSLNGPYTIDASAGTGRHDRAERRGVRGVRRRPGVHGPCG